MRGCFTRPTLSLSRLTTHHSRHSQGAASSPQSASSALNPSHPVSRSFFTSLESKRLGKHIRVRGASHKSCCPTHGVNPGGGFVGFVRGRSSFRGSVSFSSVGLSSLNVCRSRRERVVRCSSSAGADPPISAMQASPKVKLFQPLSVTRPNGILKSGTVLSLCMRNDPHLELSPYKI